MNKSEAIAKLIEAGAVHEKKEAAKIRYRDGKKCYSRDKELTVYRPA